MNHNTFDQSITLARHLLIDHDTGEKLCEANREINHALTLDTRHAKAWIIKSHIMSALGDDIAALASADMAVTCDERDAETHYTKAVVLTDIGHLEEALTAIELAFRALDPATVGLEEDLYFEKATIYTLMDRNDAALKTIDDGLRALPNSHLLQDGADPLRRAELRRTFRVIEGG